VGCADRVHEASSRPTPGSPSQTSRATLVEPQREGYDIRNADLRRADVFLGGIMSQGHDKANEPIPQRFHHHACTNFFGCGDEKGVGIFREDIKDAAFDDRTSDRLLHMDEVDQENLDNYLSARGRWRRKFLRASHLRAILKSYLDYYHRSRTHLALGKDAPEPRMVQPPELGGVVELPEVGGLHHRYKRRAA